MFAHSRDPHPAIKLWCQVLSPNPKQLFKLKCIVWSAFWKANILKIELSMIKIGVLLRKLWSLRSCFNILPPGALTPQGIEGAMKHDVSKHWCTLQWCASRGWFIAHENWTSCWGMHTSSFQSIGWCHGFLEKYYRKLAGFRKNINQTSCLVFWSMFSLRLVNLNLYVVVFHHSLSISPSAIELFLFITVKLTLYLH